MPIIIDETEHITIREQTFSYPGKQLVIDDVNEVVTVYFTDKKRFERILDRVDFLLECPDSQYLELFEIDKNENDFSINFTTNTRRSLYYLEVYEVFSRSTFEKALEELNNDSNHIIRYIKKLKTWNSSRINFSHFKHLTFDHIELIIYWVNKRKRDFKYLELDYNGIDDDLAIYLAKNLKYIFKLYLENNNITDKACVPIIACNKFITLSFRFNSGIKNENNIVYDAALRNKTCTNLKLKGTALSSALLENIYYHCRSNVHRREHASSFTDVSNFDNDFNSSAKIDAKTSEEITDSVPAKLSKKNLFSCLSSQANSSSSLPETNAAAQRWCCVQ